MKPEKRRKMTLLEQNKVRDEFMQSQELQLEWDNDVDKYMAYRRAQFAGLVKPGKPVEKKEQLQRDEKLSPVFCNIVYERNMTFAKEQKKHNQLVEEVKKRNRGDKQ